MLGRNDIPGKATKFFIYFIVTQAISQLGMYFNKTNLPIYVYSALMGPGGSLLTKTLFIIPEALGVIIFWFHFALYALPALCQLYMCSFWVKQIGYVHKFQTEFM